MHGRRKLKANTYSKKKQKQPTKQNIAKIKMFKYCERRGEDSNRAVSAKIDYIYYPRRDTDIIVFAINTSCC